MTNLQKIALKLSEIRQRLNEISGLEGDDFTEEIRNEADALQGEYKNLEIRHRAAITSEGEDEAKMRGEFREREDGEGAEIRALMRDVSIANYLTPASAGSGLQGRAKELNEALKVEAVGKNGGIAIPWAVLAGPTPAPEARAAEQRAFTDTGDYAGGIAMRPILQRLFGPGILDALGVRIDSVPAGRAEWPLLTNGVAPTQKAEGAAADDAVEGVFSTEILKPKRLTGKYEFTHEIAAQVPGVEIALRRDLADAVRAKMSDLVLNGDESTNAHEPDGFLTKISAPTDPTVETTFEDYAGSHASAVDGIHAQGEMQVSSVIGVASYRHAAATYRTAAGQESASEALKRRSAGCVASSYVPAAQSDIQNGNIFHAAGPNGGGADMRGDSIAAIWPTLEIIRDIYTNASTGVVLTWVSLWDVETAFRSMAYQRIAFKLA